MVRSRHKASASHDVNIGTLVPSEKGEPSTTLSQHSMQFGDSRPSIEIEINSLGRKRLELRNGKCARVIINTFKQRINFNGVNWKAVSQEIKDFYWEEFKKKYFWDSSNEAVIKDAWRLKHWNDPKVIQWSELYSRKSHGAANAPGPFTHTGGSITYAEWSNKLGKELGRKPTLTKLFVHTHTQKHDKETFVDQKSKEIHDAIVARREELAQTTPDSIDEN
ncbi:uncharacterized protein LOC110659467 [Hevea brasiliensis]|uniref:uncharacterized protein LOC110659467 n=1 Tax=Hevea brasiliensis TaxID=3981 RepID=UPI0025EA4BB7|nr:uncharacterized protein LOC110659467 [Hevea brasiliensis]